VLFSLISSSSSSSKDDDNGVSDVGDDGESIVFVSEGNSRVNVMKLSYNYL